MQKQTIKLDFHIDKIRPKFLKVTELMEIEKPSLILEKLLLKAKTVVDYDLRFEVDFYWTIYNLCIENASKINFQNHRKDISLWLSNCPVKQLQFDYTMWNKYPIIIYYPIVDEFQKAIICSDLDCLNSLKEDGTENEYYYLKKINEYKNYWLNNLNSYPNIEESREHLNDYVKILCLMMQNTVLMLRAVENFKKDNSKNYIINDFNLYKNKIIQNIDSLSKFKKNIDYLIKKENTKTAFYTNKHYIDLIGFSLDFLIDTFGINLLICPLKKNFENLKMLFEKSIDFDYLKYSIKEPQQNETIKPDEVYKKQYLFKVGLLFAKGIMNKYFTVNSKNETVMNNEYTAPKIAKELGNDSYNKYILASINNYTDKENGNKNIFNSLDMMTKIISHCEAEKIPVDAYFKSRLPIE